ncbi:MAG: hypothetical protein AAB431_00145 [Patescibacteria group bacterium]
MKNRFAPISDLKGLSLSPRIRTTTEGVYVRSITGSPEQVGQAIKTLLDDGYDAGGMLAIGAGTEDSNITMHLVLLDTDPGTTAIELRADVDKALIKAQRQDEFSYANMLGTLSTTGKGNEHIRVATFGGDFQFETDAQQAFDTVFDRLFDKDGKVNGAKNETRVMLLIGTDDSRCVLVANPGQDFKVLPNTEFGTERHALIGQTFVVGEYDGNKVAGLKAETIKAWLDGSDDATIEYATAELRTGGKITEIAIVDGSNQSTLFTLNGGDFAYVPASVEWKNGELQLTTDTTKATPVAMVDASYQPIVRISAAPGTKQGTTTQFAVTTVDQNGGDKVLTFGHTENMPAAFKVTANAAVRDEVYATA